MTTASLRGYINYFGIFLTTILLASSASAQITDVTPVQSPPIPGAGHGYVQTLDETVNPSNGTVSIRINVPVPGGRHLTVPFGFGYDSNTAIFINGQGYAGNNSYLAAGGWSYVVPHLDFQHKIITYYEQYEAGAPVKSTVYSCDLYNDHIFTDPHGGTHALYLALFANVSGCTAYLAGFTPTDVLTGSDGKVTATTTSALSPITVSDASGTVYYFSGAGHPLTTSNGYSALPEWVENSNGDRVTITDSGSGVFNMVDTLGRNVLASSGFGQTGNTVTVSGLSAPYKVTWGTAGGTWTPGWSVSTDCTGTGCGSCSPVQIGSPAGIPVISAITLPNQTSYQFLYDPTYGVISKIIYPTGGYVRYVWQVNHLSDAIDFYLDNNSENPQNTNFNCHERFDTVAVQYRYVSADGNPAHEYQQQTFSYIPTQWTTVPGSGTPGYEVWNAGGKSTTIVTNDTLRGTSESVSRSYAPVSLTPNPYDGSWRFVFNGNCESTCNTDGIIWSQPVYREYPVEQVTTFEDGSGNSLKTVTQSFADQYRLNCAVTAATDVTPAAISGAFYTWGAGDQVTDKKEYDFGVISNPATCETNSVPSAIPKRETAITYASFSTNPVGGTILDRPSIVQVYGGGALAAETDYSYDGYGSSGITPVTATGHDDNNFPASYTHRGNATTATHKCFVGANACTNATSTYGYDQTGQITAATDPCGNSTCPDMTGSTHTAHYYYTDSYTVLSGSSNVSYTPSGNTDGFLTKVTNALGQSSTFTYDYNSSELTASKDQNDINAARPGTTYIYNDPFARPKQVNYPDGGQTTLSYNDASPSPTVTTTKLISSGVNLSTTTVMDGIGRVVQTQVTTDPDGTDYVDTSYDGMGRVFTVSNPRRSATLPTDGTTTNTYDGLGRTTLIQRPDGSLVQTLYDQTCIVNTTAVGTIVTDEAGKIRESCSDGLGRLVEVDEPGNNGQTGEPGTGSVTFSGTEQGPVATCPPANGYCYVWDVGTFDVTVNGVLVTVSYIEGSTSSSIASALAATINGDSSTDVTATANGATVTLTADFVGSDSDYPLSVSLAGHDTQWFSSPSFSISSSGSSLTGGSGGLGTGSLVTQYTYDILGNMTCAVQKGTDTTAFSTCASASANWRPRSFVYDSLSHLTSATNPESGNITYAYDLNGNLATKVTPKPNQTGAQLTTHNYTYDVLNRLIKESHLDPADGSEQYGYDGTTLTGCTQNPPNISSPTNLVGRRSAMCGDGSSGSSWSYDQMGRALIESRTNLAAGPVRKTYNVGYTYNKDGSLSTLTYPSGDVVTYTVGGAGRSTKVTDSANNFVMSATYAPPGLLAGMTNGTGIVTSNSYNDRLQPFMLSAGPSAGAVFSQCYDFHLHVAISNPTCNLPAYTTGNNGNVFQITNNLDATRSAAFTYDSLNRVSQANTVNTTSSNCWGETYTIDNWGNLTNRSGPSGMSGNCTTEGLSATATTTNQLSGIGMVYDAGGNVTTDNLGNAYTYDAENRISTVQGYTYSYDADGTRMEKSSGSSGTMYWPGPSGALAETNLAGTINEEYIFFNGARIARVDRPSGTPHYYFSNNVGSHTVVTNKTGVCEQDIDYYPYGGVITDHCPVVAQHYKFTGKERDTESGLDYFGARHYASSMARWMSPDPINLTSARLVNPTNTLNKYVYGGNNPLKYIDRDGEDITIFYRPSGLSPTDFGHIFIGALNQNTGQVGFLDYYPQGRGNGPGEFNPGNMQDRAATSDQFATLTIRTTPDQAQKVLDLITALKSGKAPDYAALSNNCTTICEDVLHDLGLDFGDVFPDNYWAHVYGNFSPAAQDNPFKNFFVPRKTGVEYGNPRNFGVGMNFSQWLFQLYMNQQQKQQPKACVEAHDSSGQGTGTTCN